LSSQRVTFQHTRPSPPYTRPRVSVVMEKKAKPTRTFLHRSSHITRLDMFAWAFHVAASAFLQGWSLFGLKAYHVGRPSILETLALASCSCRRGAARTHLRTGNELEAWGLSTIASTLHGIWNADGCLQLVVDWREPCSDACFLLWLSSNCLAALPSFRLSNLPSLL